MGNVSSRPDEAGSLYLRDQHRFTISSLSISSPGRSPAINITPSSFPTTWIHASRSGGDPAPLEFVQDPEPSNGPPNFLLKLTNDEDLIFKFTFVIRQTPQAPSSSGAPTDPASAPLDTRINALTYVYASSPKEVETLVTREFHADPNLHKNANVALVGDHTTGGSPSVTFEWTWKWKPPKNVEDKGGGWRNSCSFVEYDPRANSFHTLASFSYWVANPPLPHSNPGSPLPPLFLTSPPKPRAVSSQTVDSRISTAEAEEPLSPLTAAHELGATGSSAPGPAAHVPPPPTIKEPVRVDVACPRPADDVTVANDGPVFRATIKALEQKTGNMRSQLKRVLKRAEQAHAAQVEANDSVAAFMEALRDASSTNANAVQPVIDHYFDKIAKEILLYQRQNAANLQKIIIDPLNRLYTYDIKQADSKRRDFEEESKDYYNYVSRYLGQRHDSVKAKKLAESDSKYQTKRRNFELKRFDYSSFMQDLHGGRKEQEVLSHLTKYADAQTSGFLAVAAKIDELLPQFQVLASEVQGADKEYQYQKREREEKRRVLEKSNLPYVEPEPSAVSNPPAPPSSSNGGYQSHSDTELGRADSTGSQWMSATAGAAGTGGTINVVELSRSPGSLGQGLGASPSQSSKFKGIRDLEERDYDQMVKAERVASQRKEGLLWALSRPGSHVDPRAQLKAGWHKFWIVLDQGKLSEYSNWKQKLDLHMDPIDLRMASVREARNAERRFCFEVITPNFKRVYQATSEEDMNSWILSINNALQGAVEGRGPKDKPEATASPIDGSSLKRDIGSILTGRNSSHFHTSSSNIPSRRTTVASRPSEHRTVSSSYDDNPDKLLQMLRDNDQGNCWCADCGSGSKVEWVSINLAIILCIECSGIHRSLGTHISKVRSLTLDITSFTPDIIELLLLVGNRVSNMTWEAKLDPSLKPSPQATREQRLKFITSKYVDRAWVAPISPTLSRYATQDDTLLAAIKKNDIQQVIYALALRANPNVTDKSRGTHAIHLALAATDPAPPSGSASLGQHDQDSRTVPFPVAELLVQNGAEIPSTLPAFPLSRSAQQYLEQKRGRAAGLGSEGLSDHSSNASLSHEQRLQREREARLQKRVSAGGRLAKSPIPER
ncbi:related to ADP-ribosylation factor (ARF) GTPase activating protein (GAP) with effector functions [Cephalotrichum gorgonifer]|uniref:ADP-ribosylation factor GTPase-activating protein n=1 Tax=Cephalotrichum gorgonifer TaxID=2041049 RepID=A0AAE8MWG7_9PEZI|nr:related to ADP-ribosylation factor (ARF) GTPase activating protein (GAP) with effector functions [Cephalotrichum gorgonifer]